MPAICGFNGFLLVNTCVREGLLFLAHLLNHNRKKTDVKKRAREEKIIVFTMTGDAGIKREHYLGVSIHWLKTRLEVSITVHRD